jgi:hypothetical protein
LLHQNNHGNNNIIKESKITNILSDMNGVYGKDILPKHLKRDFISSARPLQGHD